MFRWGILSTAKIAREHVVPALLDSENGVVSAIASRDRQKAQALAARFNIPHAFGSYEELLASDEVDGVYIPLPTASHVEWTLRAAAAGKHVLCEKPIALKADDIASLIEAREKHGVLICEAFMVFYHPQWRKIGELIAGGAIGRLRHVQGAFTYFNTDPANMRNQLSLGGGGLPDIGVYPLVTTRLVTGMEPVRVQATIERDERFGTDIYASVKADFGGFELAFYCSTQMAHRQEMIFHGEKGFIEVHAPFNAGTYDHHRFELHDQTRSEARVFRFAQAPQYRLQAEAFVRAARGEDAAVFPLESSMLNQKAIDAIYRAADHDGWEYL